MTYNDYFKKLQKVFRSMKTQQIILFLFLISINTFAQDQITTVSIGNIYKTGIDMAVYLDNDDNNYSNDTKITAKAGLKYTVNGKSNGRVFVSFFEITSDGKDASVKDASKFVNMSNWGQKYYVKESELISANKLRTAGLATGTLFLPMKVRPDIKVDNVKYPWQLSTDISLGQFVGYRIPLAKKQPYYFTLTATGGPSLLNINSNNSTDTTSTSSTLLGLTWSTGVIFEIKNIQLACIYGKDYAPGSIGRNWIYNHKGWISFGIGLKFLKADD